MFEGEFPAPIETLERHFVSGGVSLVQAVFENTFFVHPESVRARSPYYPDYARKSRQHYPGLDTGAAAEWQSQPVRLDTNARAQLAWAKYSGRAIVRGSGYGVRHIWGHPWDPSAFTAGWNLAYMPFWAGMLTEDQHPHPVVQAAIKQAGWELFFRSDPVCDPPEFVEEPGVDLGALLDGQPLLVVRVHDPSTRRAARELQIDDGAGVEATVIAIRRHVGNSWSNLSKAAAALQGLEHPSFSTRNVENTSKSHVRRMVRETGASLAEIGSIIGRLAPSSEP